MGELVLQEENKDKVGAGKASHTHVLCHMKVKIQTVTSWWKDLEEKCRFKKKESQMASL